MHSSRCHERIERILDELSRLLRGEILKLVECAGYYGRHRRTIQRDIDMLRRFIPIRRTSYGYRLDHGQLFDSLDALSLGVLASFARHASLELPFLDLDDLSEERIGFALHYRMPRTLGTQIVQAMHQARRCTFDYTKKDGEHSRRTVDPYRLFSDHGIWYLVALDHRDNHLKHFRLDRIGRLNILTETFTPDPARKREAADTGNIWQSSSATETIHLYAQPEAAWYLKHDQPIHHTQEIVDEHADGGIEVLCRISHPMEILPQIQQWMPHIHVISPASLHAQLMENIEEYSASQKKYAFPAM